MDYRVIKEGDLFFLTALNGDTGDGETGQGLYTQDTRFLSRMEVRIDGERPELLSSEADRSYAASFRLMRASKDEGAVELSRERFIYAGGLYERLAVTNYYPKAREVRLSVRFDADFQDMFIVRKYRAGEVGHITDRSADSRSLSIRYDGKDGITRETHVQWDVPADTAGPDGRIGFSIRLEPQERKEICFFITPVLNGAPGAEAHTFEEGLGLLEASYGEWYEHSTRVTSDHDVFNGLYRRGVTDLRMLMTDVGYGATPAAGLPWFAVPFGRDSVITSLFMLPLNPRPAAGTLRTLAAYQGQAYDASRDEQPGKIMHEIRFGELVHTGQSPFGPYYGSVDATPLFLVLFVEYVRWTGDLILAEELLPSVMRALEWMDAAERAGSGFLTYRQEAEKGFPNQGWKDSANSIVHDSGEYAASPIALSEVQGYVYQAKKGLAPILARLGQTETAGRLEREAAALQASFEQAFWMEDERYYAVALDREGRQVKSVTSNPGHLLMSGLPGEERAAQVAKRLSAPDLFSGFGVRTMSTDAAGYYPMSYHNGSVWPHDNAMILLGMSRLGYTEEAGRLVNGLLKASSGFETQRLPELFCGYDASFGAPVAYPGTCSPQAWAAGTAVVFVQAMLGLVPDVLSGTIELSPCLPEGFGELTAERIRIGEGCLSLSVTKQGDTGGLRVDILENTTGLGLNYRKEA
ncbi:glycogen debranching N-terminal domain-containing protein [Paenibacillus sp. S-38]|uniref:amylo-alpha-1,6-glucosidase n=1 Tax=Paenibacillus sp. S-38 TaxID=3416710 RepID=UPI003CF51220